MLEGTAARVGIIGGGSIAEAVHIPSLLAAGVDVVALAHPREERRGELAKRFQIPLQFADAAELLNDDRIDAVVVATPNATHYRIADMALRAGRHVLCEKPLAMNAAEALDLATTAEQLGLTNMVAFTFRFVPAIRFLKHLLETGVIGRPLQWRVVNFTDSFAEPSVPLGWRGRRAESGGGALMDLGPHVVDLALWLFGDIEAVAAEAATFHPRRSAPGGGLQDVEVDDSCVALARFAQGALGTFEVSRVIPGRGGTGRWNHQVIELVGSDGAIEYRLERPYHLRLCCGTTLTRSHAWVDVEVPEPFRKVPGSPRQTDLPEPPMAFRVDQGVTWVRALRGHGPASPDFRDGWRCQRVLDAIACAHQSRSWVSVQATT